MEVVIVEDPGEDREELARWISSMGGYRCSRAFETIEAALASLEKTPADVVLLDIGLPGVDGAETTRRLKARYPRMEILVLSAPGNGDRILRALCAGASGCLLKGAPPVRILEAIRGAMSGGAPTSPAIERLVIHLLRAQRRPAWADQRLSPREVVLLRLLVEGHYYKTAAAEMGVSVNTVVTYIKDIYRKLHVHSKSEAVARALREGWFA